MMPRTFGLFARALMLGGALAMNPGAILGDGAADGVAAEASPAQPWDAERSSAVRLARQGDTLAALAVLVHAG